MTILDRVEPPGVRRPIGEAEVQQIIAMRDPVDRNLWITMAYHDIAVVLGRSLGGVDVSWSAFATWASKMAGAFIRRELLSEALRAILQESLPSPTVTTLRRRLDPTGRHTDVDVVFRLFTGAIDRVADQMARGNRTVFEELAPIFARMMTLFSGPTPPAPEAVGAFMRSVKSLNDDATATAQLQSAFGHYCTAASMATAKARAEHILVGTGLIGLTEQTRLQEFIAGALNAPFEIPADVAALHDVLDQALPGHAVIPGVTTRPSSLRTWLQALWRCALTEAVMTLRTPDHVFRLGEDVLAFGRHQFPDDLRTLTEPDLLKFVSVYDRTGGTAQGSRADDWADLCDRMNYLVSLFRSWQQHGPLLQSPFTGEQIADMQAGCRPGGPL